MNKGKDALAGILEQLKTTCDVKEILAFNEREFKALIGLSPLAFVKLLAPFEQSQQIVKAHGEAQRSRPRQRKVGGGRKPTLRTSASKLGFILHFLKGYDTLDNVGDRVGFHRSNVTRNQQALLDVLLHALDQLGVLPKREFATPDELATAFAGIEELVIDATERPLLRPHKASDQKTVIVAKNIKMPLKIL
jgi:hypothetical protein